MKVSKKLLNKIIAEERVRAIVESKLPWSKSDFFHLLSEAKWYDKLEPNSVAYKIAASAAKEWDAANEKSEKRLGMTRDDYMKAQVYANAQAPHKFSQWQDYENEGSLPKDDRPRSLYDIVRKGYPDQGLPSREISTDMTLQNFLSPSDKSNKYDLNKEVETYVSPFGYVHALVPDYDSRQWGRMGTNDWVYAGDYFINERTGMPESMESYHKEDGSWMFPKVTYKTLEMEKQNTSIFANTSPEMITRSQNDQNSSCVVMYPYVRTKFEL